MGEGHKYRTKWLWSINHRMNSKAFQRKTYESTQQIWKQSIANELCNKKIDAKYWINLTSNGETWDKTYT